MRIAFVVDSFPVVSETFILAQIVGLFERGHEVDIVADLPPRSLTKVHGDIERFRLLDHTHYRSPMPAAWGTRLQSAASRVMRWGLRHPGSVLASLNVLRHGHEALNLSLLHRWFPAKKLDRDYDIIHCHFGPNGQRAIVMRKVGALRGPIITTFHGFDISLYVQRRGPAVYKELFREGEAFTCSSKFVRAKLVAAGCDPAKIFLFKLGTDLTKFDLVERKADSNGVIRLITVARLVEKKGLEYSIKAVANLVKQFPKLDYTIVGDGYLRSELSLLIERLNLQKNVALVGWKTAEEVRRLFAQSHIFVLASVVSSDGDFEGQGMVLQEAQAVGLPVVCTNHNGFPESILDGQSGFLVPERDANALSAKLAELIGRSDQWFEIGKKGRAFVEAEFDLNKRNDALVELYRRVVTEHSEIRAPRLI